MVFLQKSRMDIQELLTKICSAMTVSTTQENCKDRYIDDFDNSFVLLMVLQIGINIWNNLIESIHKRSSVYGYGLKLKCPKLNQSITLTNYVS